MGCFFEKYLDQHAEPEAELAGQCVQGHYQHVLAMPAFAETEATFNHLEDLLEKTTKPTLIILLVNAPAQASAQDIALNLCLLESAQRRYVLQARLGCINQYQHGQHAFCVIDRTTLLLPEKQGVGLARKIACDVALKLYQQKKINTSWIHVSDADVIFPDDYFDQACFHENAAALIYHFSHVPESDPHLKSAIEVYDFYLQSYVDGLTYAGSPYAFHTIGSTLAIHMEAYAKVRGFPRREAGEDFYMLNKLAKVGKIISLKGKPLLLAGRLSHRVPFGTGDAMTKITLKGKLYHPYPQECFDLLRQWLSIVNDLNLSVTVQSLKASVLDEGETLLLHALEDLDVFSVFVKTKSQAKSNQQLRHAMHVWFDGFKTLKFLRFLLKSVPGACKNPLM